MSKKQRIGLACILLGIYAETVARHNSVVTESFIGPLLTIAGIALVLIGLTRLIND